MNNESADQLIKDKNIGVKIKAFRLKSKNKGLVDFCRPIGLSASYMSQLENGRVVPTIKNLAKIAHAYNFDLAYFFITDFAANVHLKSNLEIEVIQGLTASQLAEAIIELPKKGYKVLGFSGIDVYTVVAKKIMWSSDKPNGLPKIAGTGVDIVTEVRQ